MEDGSEKRRNEATLNRQHGAPIAINVGDGMLALTMEPLLQNTRLIGLGRTLRILTMVARMARESAEGQAVELRWIRDGQYTPSDRAYLRMVLKVAHYNELRTEKENLKNRYSRLEQVANERDIQVASLGSLAGEVSSLYGLKSDSNMVMASSLFRADTNDRSPLGQRHINIGTP